MPKFTDGFYERVVVPEGERDITVFDDALPGFYIRKFISGHTSYGVKYIANGRQRRFTLGACTPGNLRQMRLDASRILAKARLGIDTRAELEADKARAAGAVLLIELIKPYLDQRRTELRASSFSETERYCRKVWQPLHQTPVREISRGTVVAQLDAMTRATADRAKVALAGLMDYALERELIAANPVLGIKKRSNTSRERVLSLSELRTILRACERGTDYGAIVALLVYTGARRSEIGNLMRREVDEKNRQLIIPAARTKQGKEHIIPCSEQAWRLISQELGWGRPDHLFGPYTAWSASKRALDQRIAKLRKGKPLQPWVLHDFRRSFSTLCAEHDLGPLHVIEAALGHAHGTAVSRVYRKAQFIRERADLMQAWANLLAS